MLILTNAGMLAILENLREAAPAVSEPGYLRDINLKLFQNDFQPDRDTVQADLTEADFDGYAGKSFSGAWFQPQVRDDGQVVMLGPSHQFNHNGGATQNTIYGYWVEKSDGTVLWTERFDNPKQMLTAEDSLYLDLIIALLFEPSAHVEQ